LSINASFGVTDYNARDDNRNLQEIIGQADQALLRSKQNGRNQSSVF